MQYQYDVFISYTRQDREANDWVNDHFKPMLERKLNTLTSHPSKVFIDREEIKSGNVWNYKILDALTNSKILVPIYCPKYFESEWCLLELWSFIYRQRKLNYNEGLICPIQLCDGKRNHKYAEDFQIEDFGGYYNTCSAFSLQPAYYNFENCTFEFAKNIEAKLDEIPSRNEEWQSEPYWQQIEKEYIKNALPLLRDVKISIPRF